MTVTVCTFFGKNLDISVRWHCSQTHRDISGENVTPAGLWTTEEIISKIVHDRFPEISVREFIDSIAFASAPFEIYQGSWSDEHWKNYGTMLKSVSFADIDWNFV